MIDRVLLKEGAGRFGVDLDAEKLEQFNTYCIKLREYNIKVNLTAIIEPYEVVVKHFIDSIAALYFLKIPYGASLIDIGTGGGFPGMPLKIVRPDLDVTLMDSQNKKLEFLRRLAPELGLELNIIHRRAEQAGADPQLRERFEFAAARAVASLDVLCEYALPLLAKGGCFAAYKGPHSDTEIEKAAGAILKLGGAPARFESYTLPDASERRIITVKKRTKTPPIYPRQRVNINNNPL
jgi:16S rRNA (guanine527-N7)-methyltransferase